MGESKFNTVNIGKSKKGQIDQLKREIIEDKKKLDDDNRRFVDSGNPRIRENTDMGLTAYKEVDVQNFKFLIDSVKKYNISSKDLADQWTGCRGNAQSRLKFEIIKLAYIHPRNISNRWLREHILRFISKYGWNQYWKGDRSITL